MSLEYRHEIENRARRYGELTHCVGFGVRRNKAWRIDDALPALEWSPTRTRGAGKNSADIELACRAMQLLASGDVDCFCIASGDSDFAPLARVLREAGKMGVGTGGSDQSGMRFQEACDRFERVDNWTSSDVATGPPGCEAARAEFIELVTRAVGMDASKWHMLSWLGLKLRERSPGIEYGRYGVAQLLVLIETYPEDFETREVRDAHEFRLRPK